MQKEQKNRLQYSFITVVALLMVVLLIVAGCHREQEKHSESANATNTVSPESKLQEGKPQEPSKPSEPETPPITRESLPEIEFRTGSTATSILKEMVKVYKNTKTYADNGHVDFTVKMPDGSISRQQRSAVFAYERPNKVRAQMNTSSMVCDGKNLYANAGGNEYFMQMLELPAPQEINIPALYPDYILAQSGDLGVPPEIFWLPPQMILLFAKDPLQTLVPPGAEVGMLGPEYIISEDGKGAFACDRITVTDKLNGQRIFWIDRKTNALMRIQIPVDRLQSNANEVKPVSITVELSDAVLDATIGDTTFVMMKPDMAEVVKRITPPEVAALGKTIQNTTCFNAKKQQIALVPPGEGITAVALLFVTDPQAAPACQAAAATLRDLATRFADNPKIVFYPVSVDPESVSDTSIETVLKIWGVNLPFYRQPGQELLQELGVSSAPTFLVLDDKSKLQLLSILSVETNDLARIVGETAAGRDPYLQLKAQFDEQVAKFRQMINEFVSYDIFYTAESLVEILKPSEPQSFVKKELWSNTNLKNPCNPHVVQTPSNSFVLLPHDLQKISVLQTGTGKILMTGTGNDAVPATIIPSGISREMPLHIIRDAAAPEQKRYFAVTGINQKQLFLFDETLQLAGTWPPQPDAKNYEISAVQLGDLTGDKIPEVIIGCRNLVDHSTKLLVTDLTGKTLWEDKNVSEPDQVVYVLKEGKPYLWVVNRYENKTTIAEFDSQGKKLREWSPTGEMLIWKLFADDLDNDGNSEVLAILASTGEIFAAGIGLADAAEPLWRKPISPGLHQVKSFEFVTSGNLVGDAAKEWVVAAADSTIYLFNQSGEQLDSFAEGKNLSGIAVSQFDAKPLLIMSTVTDDLGNTGSRDAVFAYTVKSNAEDGK